MPVLLLVVLLLSGCTSYGNTWRVDGENCESITVENSRETKEVKSPGG